MSVEEEINPMDIMKPLHLTAKELAPSQPFTSVEMGKLWVTYNGNSMSIQILSNLLIEHGWMESPPKAFER